MTGKRLADVLLKTKKFPSLICNVIVDFVVPNCIKFELANMKSNDVDLLYLANILECRGFLCKVQFEMPTLKCANPIFEIRIKNELTQTTRNTSSLLRAWFRYPKPNGGVFLRT